ncbi:alpha/beta hydrolase [Parapedobacter indicus]|uniref:S-formylglutathione hydrolase FrmB n=1 Tax=Parapedobacter indicus TaxID=1477437 RepID=A0A1I3QPM8_9SPHI|nr:alpha/beta hydrolase family protein [Parapedobacter indicus]PPL00171.1 S-formylglutathione hydrolase FrmB [Parapedobacter indicus]SFJ35067.1 S-formylglutathione hydrolase FrmB [Parapedobacter indicus]
MKNYLISLLAMWYVADVYAAKVDTIAVDSRAMGKAIKTVVIVPDDYDSLDSLPVVYLLHGYSGNYADWVTKAPEIKDIADRYHFMIVCPDGGYGSWYWDSPVDDSFQYETFVSRELVKWVDANYKTLRSRQGRAISGLSMGGHGALYLAMRHLDVYGAAGSTAGGVDIRPFPLNWDMAERLGSYADYPERWDAHTVINQLHRLTPDTLALVIDCGTGDFFYHVNEQLHRKLLDRNIPHTYITGPGAHNWMYWQQSICYQLLYFHEFFGR